MKLFLNKHTKVGENEITYEVSGDNTGEDDVGAVWPVWWMVNNCVGVGGINIVDYCFVYSELVMCVYMRVIKCCSSHGWLSENKSGNDNEWKQLIQVKKITSNMYATNRTSESFRWLLMMMMFLLLLLFVEQKVRIKANEMMRKRVKEWLSNGDTSYGEILLCWSLICLPFVRRDTNQTWAVEWFVFLFLLFLLLFFFHSSVTLCPSFVKYERRRLFRTYVQPPRRRH